MKVGLVGTGHWAETAHAPALVKCDEVEFVGVWGRNADKTHSLASRLNVRAYSDIDGLIRDVDALDFAVPPDVQKEIALRAAAAGKHLVLEKPIALSLADADELVLAISDAGVCAVVFHTSLFKHDVAEWMREAQKVRWVSGTGEWVSDALSAPESPFGHSRWRQEFGALWDIGPHMLSLFIPLLGPVTGVMAVHGLSDTVHLVLTHTEGRTSSSTLTLNGPPRENDISLKVWNTDTLAALPASQVNPVDALTSALTSLNSQVSGVKPTGSSGAVLNDAAFARDIVAVLDAAERQLRSRGSAE